jgi:glycosyltransferase involved in cell wall biosynthesis
MKVLHLNLINAGGAWIAAKRINECISETSPSRLISMNQLVVNGFSKIGPRIDFALEKKSNVDMTVSFYRSALQRQSFEMLEQTELQDVSVLNLHWMPGKISSELNKTMKGKKVFWTLHDMNPITGYCHHAFSCQSFKQTCSHCPQSPRFMHKGIELAQAQKAKIIEERNVQIIAPSKWILNHAQRSLITRNSAIFYIPNPIPVEIFQKLPYPQTQFPSSGARRIRIGVLGTNYNGSKGAQNSREILKSLVAIFPNQVIPCFIGDIDPLFKDLMCIQLKKNSTEKETADFLGELDLLIYTSLADTLPNLLLEAQSCGVPIVAWDVGGVADTFIDRESGLLVGPTLNEAIEAAESVINNDCRREDFSKKARENVIEKFSYPVIAKQYLKAYSN